MHLQGEGLSVFARFLRLVSEIHEDSGISVRTTESNFNQVFVIKKFEIRTFINPIEGSSIYILRIIDNRLQKIVLLGNLELGKKYDIFEWDKK